MEKTQIIAGAVYVMPRAARRASLPRWLSSISGVGVDGITFSLMWQRLPVHPAAHLIREEPVNQAKSCCPVQTRTDGLLGVLMERFDGGSFPQHGCLGYTQTAGVVNQHKRCHRAKKDKQARRDESSEQMEK